MKEVWKDIRGYEGYYQISNYGNVRSVDRFVNSKNNSKSLKIGRLKKPSGQNMGYVLMLLDSHGTDKAFLVHRLVAKAFVPNLYNKPEVNHKDGIKSNNYFGNLEWCTRSENAQHSFSMGLQKPKKSEDCNFAKIKESDVLDIIKLSNIGMSNESISELFPINANSIRRIIKRETWKNAPRTD